MIMINQLEEARKEFQNTHIAYALDLYKKYVIENPEDAEARQEYRERQRNKQFKGQHEKRNVLFALSTIPTC